MLGGKFKSIDRLSLSVAEHWRSRRCLPVDGFAVVLSRRVHHAAHRPHWRTSYNHPVRHTERKQQHQRQDRNRNRPVESIVLDPYVLGEDVILKDHRSFKVLFSPLGYQNSIFFSSHRSPENHMRSDGLSDGSRE